MAKHINKPIEIWIYNRVKYDKISTRWVGVYLVYQIICFFQFVLSYLFSVFFFSYFFLYLYFILWQCLFCDKFHHIDMIRIILAGFSHLHVNFYIAFLSSKRFDFSVWCFKATNGWSVIHCHHTHTIQYSLDNKSKQFDVFKSC